MKQIEITTYVNNTLQEVDDNLKRPHVWSEAFMFYLVSIRP